MCCLQTSYQLAEADYSGSDLGGGWVMRLAAGLEMQLTWLQPLLTSACWESLTLLLLDKLLARLEVLLGRKVGGLAVQIGKARTIAAQLHAQYLRCAARH